MGAALVGVVWCGLVWGLMSARSPVELQACTLCFDSGRTSAQCEPEREENLMAKRSSSSPKKKAGAKAAKEKAAKRSAAKKKSTRNAAASAGSAAPGITPDHGRQRSAKAAAKKSRTKISGLKSRIRGHVSGRGKRAQARRDSKN